MTTLMNQPNTGDKGEKKTPQFVVLFFFKFFFSEISFALPLCGMMRFSVYISIENIRSIE